MPATAAKTSASSNLNPESVVVKGKKRLRVEQEADNSSGNPSTISILNPELERARKRVRYNSPQAAEQDINSTANSIVVNNSIPATVADTSDKFKLKLVFD